VKRFGEQALGSPTFYLSLFTPKDGENRLMATDPTISLKIRSALGEYLKRDPAAIRVTHHLREDLGLDSMAVIELLYRIEEAFDLQIPDQDLVGLTTVGHVVTYVEKRLGKAATPAKTKKTIKPTKTKGKKKS
jgi:acyl carrier protein